MLIQTSIQPRADGTVIVQGLDRKTYVFKAEDDESGLTCEIEHEKTIANLLSLKTFFPALTGEDSELLSALELDEVDELAELDDEVQADALPIEANTTPVKAPTQRVRSRK